jgi:septal ring factor EnvC (AmiA/AmiB activator)
MIYSMKESKFIVALSLLCFVGSIAILDFVHGSRRQSLISQIEKLNLEIRQTKTQNEALYSKISNLSHILEQLGNETCYTKLDGTKLLNTELHLKLEESYVERAFCDEQDRVIQRLQFKILELESECGL